jgi:hypothetical protein
METQTEKPDAVKEARKTGGLLFSGCMFIGMAAGWFSGAFTIGLFCGMGLGFIMMAVVLMSQTAKNK